MTTQSDRQNGEGLRAALEKIRAGSFEGASTLVIDGGWKLFVEKLQNIAAKALLATQLARDATEGDITQAQRSAMMLARSDAAAPPKPAPDAMREGTRLPDQYDDGFTAGRKHERDRQIAITLDRDWLGRMVRHAWVEWAKLQETAKPRWLLPYDELSEPDKEADRQIGEYLIEWAKKYVPATLATAVPPADELDEYSIRALSRQALPSSSETES